MKQHLIHPRLAVTIFFFVNGVVFATWASRIPDFMSKYEIDNGQMGFVLLSHSIGAFIAMPITGYLIYRYGSKMITILSALLFVLFFTILPHSGSYFALFVPFFLVGASTGIMDVAMNAQAVDVEKHFNKPMMTFFHAMFSIGMVAGGLIGAWFISHNQAMIIHFLILAIGAFILCGLGYLGLLSHATSEEEPDVSFLVLPKGPVIGLGIIAFCCMIGEGAMSDWSTNYIKNIMHAPDALTTFGLTGFAGAMTIGRLFGDRFRTIYGDGRILFIGSILSILGMLLIVTKLNLLIVIVGFGIVGLGLSNIVPIVYSLSGSLPGIPTGTGIAMVTTIGYSGFMLGPPLIGFLADLWDLRFALFLILILFVLMFFILRRYQNQNPPSPKPLSS